MIDANVVCIPSSFIPLIVIDPKTGSCADCSVYQRDFPVFPVIGLSPARKDQGTQSCGLWIVLWCTFNSISLNNINCGIFCKGRIFCLGGRVSANNSWFSCLCICNRHTHKKYCNYQS